MTSEESLAAAELRAIVEVVREALLWQAASGAVGVPRPVKARSGEPVRLVQSAVPAEAREEADRGVGPEQGGARLAEAPARQPAVVRPLAPAVTVPVEQRVAVLAALAEEVRGCDRCVLHATRTQTVFARGNPSAELMIVGEGPGAEEDAQGEPFVGRAGQLLDRMIGAMGYGRDEVYIANIVKCRPPNNRTPHVDEMQACMPYLQRQIEVVSPRVILAMGTTAVRGLLGVTDGIMRLRGKWKLYKGRIPVMPTYHPAYLLREEEAKRDAKREVWMDLKAVLAALGRSVPAR